MLQLNFFLTGNSKWIDFVGTQNQVSLLINCLLFSTWLIWISTFNMNFLFVSLSFCADGKLLFSLRSTAFSWGSFYSTSFIQTENVSCYSSISEGFVEPLKCAEFPLLCIFLFFRWSIYLKRNIFFKKKTSDADFLLTTLSLKLRKPFRTCPVTFFGLQNPLPTILTNFVIFFWKNFK